MLHDESPLPTPAIPMAGSRSPMSNRQRGWQDHIGASLVFKCVDVLTEPNRNTDLR